MRMKGNPTVPPPLLTSTPKPYSADWSPEPLFDLSRWFRKRKQKPDPAQINAELLREAYEQATEIGIPAELRWRMSYTTMLLLSFDGVRQHGAPESLFGLFIVIDNDTPIRMVYLEGDAVDVTLTLHPFTFSEHYRK